MEAVASESGAAAFARWFLALFYCAVGMFYILRIRLLSRSLNQPVTYKGEPGSQHWQAHQTFRFFRVLILVVCLARVAWPSLDTWLLPIPMLWHPNIMLAGCGLLTLSFAGIVAVNLYMKQEWRSGSRPGEPGQLITTGPYSVTRNPMMAMVLAGQLAFFLAMPSAFTLICLVVGVWAVTTQVNVEQSELMARFGEEYRRYTEVTPRWLFRDA